LKLAISIFQKNNTTAPGAYAPGVLSGREFFDFFLESQLLQLQAHEHTLIRSGPSALQNNFLINVEMAGLETFDPCKARHGGLHPVVDPTTVTYCRP
jgi:hypothetical protein